MKPPGPNGCRLIVCSSLANSSGLNSITTRRGDSAASFIERIIGSWWKLVFSATAQFFSRLATARVSRQAGGCSAPRLRRGVHHRASELRGPDDYRARRRRTRPSLRQASLEGPVRRRRSHEGSPGRPHSPPGRPGRRASALVRPEPRQQLRQLVASLPLLSEPQAKVETMETVEAPALVSVAEAAKLVHVSRAHMWRLVDKRAIPAFRLGEGHGPLRVDRDGLLRWLEEKRL